MYLDESNAGSHERKRRSPICAWFLGDAAHADFAEVVDAVRTGTQRTVFFADARDATAAASADFPPPELIIIAQSRPGTISLSNVESLRRRFPLPGVISLLGSWCEGESRTGRPIPGVERFYWHEFPGWWQRQMARRAAGRCADWARLGTVDKASRPYLQNDEKEPRGLVVINTPRWETADALADLLQSAGYASVWHLNGRPAPQVRGAVAGIWEGGQMDDHEADDLASFCGQLSRDAAPVVALLDFPRHDGVERARRLGAAAVLGKPWMNAELVAALEVNIQRCGARASAMTASLA